MEFISKKEKIQEKKNRAVKIISEILKLRGYNDIFYIDEENIILADKTLIVFFSVFSKLNKNTFEIMLNKMRSKNIKDCIIISREKITSYVKNIIPNFIDNSIELFNLEELQYFITEHIFLQKHELIDYKNPNITKKLPKILKTDIISRIYNFKKGNVIKTTDLKTGEIQYNLVV